MNAERNKEAHRRIIAYALFVFWIILILILGSSPGSSAQTSRFIKPLIEFFFPSASPDTFLIVHAIIRKTAHFTEYGVLAFLAVRAFLISSNTIRRFCWLLAFLSVTVVAAADEINQSFQNSRTSSVWDVLLDIAGGACVLIFLYLFRFRRGRDVTNEMSGGR